MQILHSRHTKTMPYEVTSHNTKLMLANSFKKLLEQMPFKQITVTKVIADCGLNRKTFYYHFENTERLLRWLLQEEAFNVVRSFDLMNDYRSAIRFAMDYISKNNMMLHNMISSIERENLRTLFYDDFYDVIHEAIIQSIKILEVTVSEEFLHFLTDMYARIVGGLIIDFVYGRTDDEVRLLEYICTIFNEMLPNMLRTAHERNL